jgi:hypothetical protein
MVGFSQLGKSQSQLLGAPLLQGQAMNSLLEARCNDLDRIMGRLALLGAHDALVILRAAFGSPIILHILRSSPCFGHASLRHFDELLRSGLEKIVNCEIGDLAWSQASLPIRNGGLGIRSVVVLAPSAFLASAASTLSLQMAILAGFKVNEDSLVDDCQKYWIDSFYAHPPNSDEVGSQRAWDMAAIETAKDALEAGITDVRDRARLLAVMAPHSGDWLKALPISACGLRLSDDEVRIAVCLRLGCNTGMPHSCKCGAAVDCFGIHGLSCRLSAGRQSRHHSLNDIVYHALIRAGLPSIKEPSGSMKEDARRPDGVTLVPWSSGKCLAWDATVTDTMAFTHSNRTVHVAGSAAEFIAAAKTRKYESLTTTKIFVPLAFETYGPICSEGVAFIEELGRRITSVSDDPRETSFLFQRLSVAVQRGNAVSVLATFCRDTSRHPFVGF